MSIIDSLISRVLDKGIVLHKRQLSAHAWHIRFQSATLKDVSYTPGNFLRIHCGLGQVRSYSVWNFNREACEIDIAACTHSAGPGSNWISAVQPGDPIHYRWHKGKFVLDDSASAYIFVGDLSALGHLYEIQRHLRGRQINGIFYSHSENDFFPDIDNTTPFEFMTLPANPIAQLTEVLSPMSFRDNGTPMAYLAGDSRTVAALYHYLREEKAMSPKQIHSKPFWNISKRGLE